MSDTPLTPPERQELFGEPFDDAYAHEAQQRWGQTQAWRESQRRTATYGAEQWRAMAADGDAVNAAFAAAQRAGAAPDSGPAMDAAEAHRRHITEWFYDLDHPMHRMLADMYLSDPRFSKTYDDVAPGLARYVHDAIHANADRQPSRTMA